MAYIYMNEDEIDSELFCLICNEPFQEPVNCIQCGQTYCQNCIRKWYEQQRSCPSCRHYGDLFSPVLTRIVHNQLNRLLVQCSLCLQTNIKRLEYLDHLLTLCPKSMINCPDKCGWRGQKENLEKHLYRCRNRACCCS